MSKLLVNAITLLMILVLATLAALYFYDQVAGDFMDAAPQQLQTIKHLIQQGDDRAATLTPHIRESDTAENTPQRARPAVSPRTQPDERGLHIRGTYLSPDQLRQMYDKVKDHYVVHQGQVYHRWQLDGGQSLDYQAFQILLRRGYHFPELSSTDATPSSQRTILSTEHRDGKEIRRVHSGGNY